MQTLKKLLLHSPGLLALGAAWWALGFLFFGSACGSFGILVSFLVCLPLGLGFAWASRRMHPAAALVSGLALLAALRTGFLLSLEASVRGSSGCLVTLVSPYFLLSLALIFIAWLVAFGCNRIVGLPRNDQNNWAAHGPPATGTQQSRMKTGWAVLTLALLVLAKALHTFYWLMVWDSTYDPLGYLWLIPLFAAVLFGGALLLVTLPRRVKWSGAAFAILVSSLLFGASTLAQRVDFRQLTQARAERISRAVDAYHERAGRYPESLRQLVPWYVLSIPGPVIIPTLGWCYEGGEDFYRLGYVNRLHWSDPNLFGVVAASAGNVSQLPPVCAQEIAETNARQNRPPAPVK